ncbi:hypothetical protein OPV22_021129 [Ensete ventricosum]|uniref:Uncharacterized protein n=1 Tax=Ensete ventricosum TaxID=4639 RepID=A0AAV8QGF6_ENSVE|nr:hypothetical protein OPV22_021129 [Ensete ventricosum]
MPFVALPAESLRANFCLQANLLLTVVVSAKGGVSLPSSGVAETGFRLVLASSGRGGRDRTDCRCWTARGSDRRSSTTLADFDVGFDGESDCSLTAQRINNKGSDLINLSSCYAHTTIKNIYRYPVLLSVSAF